MSSTAIGSRRTAVEIVHSILSVCDNGGINKTAIMYRNNLSYDQLRRYLSLLSDRNLIGRNEAGQFQITPTGRKTLKRVSNVVETLSDLRKDLEPSVTSG